MATITYMSWNIETYGPGKHVKNGVAKKNYSALLRAVAQTAGAHNVNMISLLELSKSSALDIGGDLIDALVVEDSTRTGNTQPLWQGTIVETTEKDVYTFLWQKGNGFEAEPEPGNPKGFARGLVTKNAAGQVLKFHSAHSQSGGRTPGYVLFKTTDRAPANPEVYFTAISYHAMYNKTKANNNIGLASIAAGAEITQAQLNNAPVAVTASIISGDFNVDLLTATAAYNALGLVGTGAITTAANDRAKTSLANDQQPNTATVMDYRRNAYDNIYCHAVTAGPNNSTVIDLLDEFGAWNGAAGNLQEIAGSFDPDKIKTSKVDWGSKITNLPPTTPLESWIIYRWAISNHYPVLTTVQI